MTVHGNTYLVYDDVIRVNIQSNESVDANDERIYDEYFSGRWLITHCRHVINPREHETVIQCVKDTYFNALPVGEPIDTTAIDIGGYRKSDLVYGAYDFTS